MTKPFRENLANSIREVGRWVTENADDIAGTTELRTYLRIVISYDWGEQIPGIAIERGHVCKEAVKALKRAEDE